MINSFRTKVYRLPTEKIRGQISVKFAVLADLHGIMYGRENQELFERIAVEKPDAVLIPGDMVYSSDPATLMPVAGFLARLADQYPVFYSLGNHEYRMMLDPEIQEKYLAYERSLTNAGVCFLHNEHTSMKIRETDFVFCGLELPMEYYKKPRSPALSLTSMEEFAGPVSQDGIQVLLAHNPKYGNTYFSWGADIIFSGHYHGGMIRINEHHGLISPQFHLFPAFCCGDFHRGKSHMIVSAGLGEHTIPVRIHNPRELVFAELFPTALTERKDDKRRERFSAWQ